MRGDPTWRLNSIVALSVLLGLNLHDLLSGDRGSFTVAIYALASLICIVWIVRYARELRAAFSRRRSIWIRIVDDPAGARRRHGGARRLRADVDGVPAIDVAYGAAQEAPEDVAVMVTNALGASAHGGATAPDWAELQRNRN